MRSLSSLFIRSLPPFLAALWWMAVVAASVEAPSASKEEQRSAHQHQHQQQQQQQQEDECSEGDVDYLIVGAGGSGIQMALFLKKYGYTFQILEKEDTAGYFWTKYPVFQELISVNKHVQNETQRLRYDWHSMLETPVAMWDVSKRYYPTGKDWHDYMERVVEQAEIDIEFGTEVSRLLPSTNTNHADERKIRTAVRH